MSYCANPQQLLKKLTGRLLLDSSIRGLVVRLVEHHMFFLVRYESGKLIYTRCHLITSHKLGRCAVQNIIRVWHTTALSHNILHAGLL